MKTAVIYARYSSNGQTEQSIEGQVRECTDYANAHDIVIVDMYIDRAMTGTNDNRFDFQRMLKDASKRAWDMVLVYKLDRFSRNKYEMAIHRKTLKDNDIKLVSVKENIPDTPEGVILESMLEGMAEYYSLELAQKVKRGQKETRIKGNYAGGCIPYGYRVEKTSEGKKYVICEEEAAVVVRIYEEYAAGKIGRDIISGLTADGILKRNGKPFGKNMLYGILQNERYSGIYRHKTDGVFTNTFPRIVPQELYETVRKIAENNKIGGLSNEDPYLLRGKVICGICGKNVRGDAGTARNGTTLRYYACSGRKQVTNKCKKKPVPKKLIEDIVTEVTVKSLSVPGTIDTLVDKIFKLNNERANNDPTLVLLNKELQQCVKSIDNLLNAIEQGIITTSTKERLTELENRRTEFEQKIAIRNANARIKLTKQEITKFIGDALQKEAGTVIKMLVKQIVLYDDKIEIYYKYTDRRRLDEEDSHQVFCFYENIIEKEYSQKHFNQIEIVAKTFTERFTVRLYI